jgi:hypothetical protein
MNATIAGRANRSVNPRSNSERRLLQKEVELLIDSFKLGSSEMDEMDRFSGQLPVDVPNPGFMRGTERKHERGILEEES